MVPPQTVVTTWSCSLLLIYRPRKDERLSRPSWLTYNGRFTHISGHQSAAGTSQDSESSPVKDQRSTAAPRNQPINPCQPLTQKQNTVRRSNFLEWLPTWGVTVTATFRSQGQRSQDHCERKYEKIFSVHIFAKYIDDLHQYFRWQWRFGWWFGLVVTRWPRST